MIFFNFQTLQHYTICRLRIYSIFLWKYSYFLWKLLLCCWLLTSCCYPSLFAQILCLMVFSISKQVLHNELNIIVMGISEVFYFCPPDLKSPNTCEDLFTTQRLHFWILSMLRGKCELGDCDRHLYHISYLCRALSYLV